MSRWAEGRRWLGSRGSILCEPEILQQTECYDSFVGDVTLWWYCNKSINFKKKVVFLIGSKLSKLQSKDVPLKIQYVPPCTACRKRISESNFWRSNMKYIHNVFITYTYTLYQVILVTVSMTCYLYLKQRLTVLYLSHEGGTKASPVIITRWHILQYPRARVICVTRPTSPTTCVQNRG